MNAGPLEGILAVDKPSGPTSHDVVARLRRLLGVRRIGHTGTLDPFASGLLLLCVGRATRLAEYLSGRPKGYEAVARLGRETDTLDLEGKAVTESDAWRGLTPEEIEEALAGFRGEILQTPPQYSAKKVGGEAMHRRARRGEHVELEPASVTLHELTLVSVDLPDVTLKVHCSSGTYVRALARDLGRALGVGAHLTALRRTAVGNVDVAAALEGGLLFDDAADAAAVQAALKAAWVDPLEALAHLPAVKVDAAAVEELSRGRPLPWDAGTRGGAGAGEPETFLAVHGDRLVAVAERREGRLQPRKVLVEPSGAGGIPVGAGERPMQWVAAKGGAA
ncbi:MAG: tRNA pseudouridine(55) synthase TruB [Gemmatimonadota bacterium]